MISFEIDQAKSQGNLSKHGTNFVDAQLLWNDPQLLEIPVISVRRSRTEEAALYEG